MNELEKRLAALSPEQRELLELRLRKQGLQTLLAADASVSANDARESRGACEADWRDRPPARAVSFSLYFFSGDGSKAADDKYRLVLEGARFADRQGFSAVWTPERHFQDFGGLYPNPSVLGAALAVLTERIQFAREASPCRSTILCASRRSGRSWTISRADASPSRSLPAGTRTTSSSRPTSTTNAKR